MSDYKEEYARLNLPPEYQPISMWGYFGYQILFSIPVVGFIVLIIIAVSAGNVNLRNYARSYFCILIITLIILAIISGIVIAAGGFAYLTEMMGYGV